MFSWAQNTKLTHFDFFFKSEIFGCYKSTPLRWISSSRFAETDEKDKDALREAKVTAALETKTLI